MLRLRQDHREVSRAATITTETRTVQTEIIVRIVEITAVITEETVISETMETKDPLTVDRRATVTVVAVRRDREKAVRHVRVKAMAVQ